MSTTLLPTSTMNPPSTQTQTQMQTQTHLVQGQAALLPSIILEKIFFFVEPRPFGVVTRLPIHRHRLTQVCRSWRDVALERNGLWTTIDVHTDCTSIRQLTKGVGLVETLLARTGAILPLDVTVSGNPWSTSWPYPSTTTTKSGPYDTATPHERVQLTAAAMYRYMRLLAPVRHRLRTLSLSFGFDRPAELEAPLPGTWPWNLDDMRALESLYVTYPTVGSRREAGTIDVSACSDRLRRCDITGCMKVCLTEGVVLSALTYLRFDLYGSRDNALVASWYNVLRRTPALTGLVVVVREDLDWDPHHHSGPGAFTPIALPRLTSLRVRYTEDMEEQNSAAPYQFLNALQCPLLQALAIICEYRDAADARGEFLMHDTALSGLLFPFLRDNGGMLEELEIGDDVFNEHELAWALVRCTRLRHLHFRSVRFASNSELLKLLHLECQSQLGDTGPYCPNLEYLMVTECHLPPTIKTADIVEMIVGRHTKEGSKLKYFDFDYCDLDGFDEDPTIRAIRDEQTKKWEEEQEEMNQNA